MRMRVEISLVLGAAVLDYLIGDPWHWLHPVQVIGAWITWGHHWLYRWCGVGWPRRLAGVGLGLSTIAGTAIVSWGLLWLARQVHWALELAVAMVLLASCLAARSLRQAAEDVLEPLQQGDLGAARSRLSRYVGRDTAALSESEILRAVLETVAENTTDGVTGPLFFALLGLWTSPWTGVGAVPWAMAYKAASTLDSMVGYRREPYTDLGWFSAQLEDRLTWLPCRLTVGAIAILSGRPGRVWRLCCRDAPQDPSPNSGWSECAYAAALGVQLGGENLYQGQVKVKPLLGEAEVDITVVTVQQALRFLRWVCWLWLGVGVVIPGVVQVLQG
ncbi:MAG: cobalamin biosynthesis protein CobD [Spirulina sp. SIO3F2]|nr:cobalamin biosynthesis protein CobD [Spirulina sp. SIO3F2]